MEASSWIVGILLCTALMAFSAPSSGNDLYDVDVRQLSEQWARERISPQDPYSLKPADLARQLEDLVSHHPAVFRLETAGRSVEGREIHLVQIGRGSRRILLWSQMHGDEPTATCALLDLLVFFGLHREDPWVAEILGKFTLLSVPMLNPDGAEHFQRRNAQGIDINRDARLLQSPEGRLLKELRDRFHPFLGFNLHNQNSLTTVGDTGRVATIALLAVAADLPGPNGLAAGTSKEPPDDRYLTKRIAAVLFDALSPFVYGHISRYDESFNPRAFGDNLTLWGTPIVLIESGGSPAGQPPDFTVKLNYVGLLAAFNSLATGKVRNANPAVFDSLKMNSEDPIFDLMLRNAWIFTGRGIPPFRGDVAVRHDARAGSRSDSIVADLGDLGVYSAHRTIDCTGALLTPGLIAWDSRPSSLSEKIPDEICFRSGVSTLIETITYEELLKAHPAPDDWKVPRRMNWSFLVSGSASREDGYNAIRLAEWLAAGARAWVIDRDTSALAEDRNLPSWFGVDLIPQAVAAEYRIPSSLEGEPHLILPRWTSEAARRFHIPRRGIIAPGAVADLVIWTSPSEKTPLDMREFRPSRIIIDGQLDSEPHGRFLGRAVNQ
jgi:hypothetical protein